MFLKPFKIDSLTIGLGGMELGCQRGRKQKIRKDCEEGRITNTTSPTTIYKFGRPQVEK